MKNESVVEGQWNRGYEEVKDCVLEESPASASPSELVRNANYQAPLQIF